jgi:CheY-like chemotaxis protein
MTNKTKILLVDDNQAFLDMLKEYLMDNNYDIVCSNNGSDAQEQFEKFHPDIIVTDIVMPEVDGIELLLTLRKINPDVRIIAMSGGNRGHAESYLIMAEKLGANVVLNKPFELPVFLDEIKKLEID